MQSNQVSWRSVQLGSLLKVWRGNCIGKKWSLILLAILFWSMISLVLPPGVSATNVSGDILTDTTWTKAAAPTS